ncbi:thap domain protein [Holotrichia oblita]|uniref:Thap domain protein n=1 Tax=Holotrichia oblita TaxID=644536 RepID=A0ACB9TML4_HOLOL|nr:thap domain protein [Holotrichia oblita]
MKYLIACSADGLISYISFDFGGRTTDKTIVEELTFLNLLEPGAEVMADRRFKHIADQLATIKNHLVRPPSVLSGQKSSKEVVKEAKRIASLRIHVERVTSRIRDFAILQSHATIKLSLVKYLDLIVQIVCGIINIQDYLNK